MSAERLVAAIGQNNIKAVERLVESGADVNEVSQSGFAPLCIAAFWGLDQIVKYLLQHSADIEQTNAGTNWTALHCAAFQGHGKVIMHLLSHKPGPDLTKQDSRGRKAVDFASTTEKIWGFFAAKGCKRATKADLVKAGIIQKVEVKPEDLNPIQPEGNRDPLLYPSANEGQRYASFSRPGSAYVVRSMNPTGPFSRPGSSSSRADSSAGKNLGPPSKLNTKEMYFWNATQNGDVLSVPSPVAEGEEKNFSPAAGAVMERRFEPKKKGFDDKNTGALARMYNEQ